MAGEDAVVDGFQGFLAREADCKHAAREYRMAAFRSSIIEVHVYL
jgi:hypothetical protein